MRWPLQPLSELLAKFLEFKPVQKAAVVGVPAVVIVVVVTLAVLGEPDDGLDEQGRLVQQGTVAGADGPGTYNVTYPRPYASPPDLRWLSRPTGYNMLEERPDGFRVEITRRGPHDLTPRWEARGIPAEKGRERVEPAAPNRTWG